MKRIRSAFVLLAGIVVGGPLSACLWDLDTIELERYRFPEAMELIAGKFLRHSPEFYEWRIRDRLERLESGEDLPEFYDDLAVAYDKTGQHDRAIETILQKEERFPGRYETYANLGTFYIHSSRFEQGLTWLDRAIEINPDAHFGREIYQRLLVEYVLSRMQDGRIVLPLRDTSVSSAHRNSAGFAVFLAQQIDSGARPRLSTEQMAAAVKGVLGMMHFGRHDSPILLEALGDLLSSPFESTSDAKQLAAFAYLKASQEAEDSQTREHYRQFAIDAVAGQSIDYGGDYSFDALERTLQDKIREADEWYTGVRADELSWIQAGLNADEEFRRKYYQLPAVTAETPRLDEFRREDARRRHARDGRGNQGSVQSEWAATMPFLGIGAVVLACIAVFYWMGPPVEHVNSGNQSTRSESPPQDLGPPAS